MATTGPLVALPLKIASSRRHDLLAVWRREEPSADAANGDNLALTARAAAEHLVRVHQRANPPPLEVGPPGVSDALEERLVPASPYQDRPWPGRHEALAHTWNAAAMIGFAQSGVRERSQEEMTRPRSMWRRSFGLGATPASGSASSLLS